MTRKKQPKKKVEIVFDPLKRKEFLTGFRKRKNERRTRAKVELERNLKEERIRIRQEVKDGFKHLKKSYEPLKELTEEEKAEANVAEAYEDEEVQVKIVELTTNDLAAQRNMLGTNQAEDTDEDDDAEESDNGQMEQDETNRIPGMDFDHKPTKTKQTPSASTSNPKSTDDVEFKSKKDLDKLMKTKTLKKIKKSKLFKMKEQIDKRANLKKVKRDRNNTIKSVPKHQRKKLKYGHVQQQTKYRKGRMVNKKERRKRANGGD